MWINPLFKQGAVTAEDFLGQAGSSEGSRPKAGDIDGRFRESLNKAITLAEAKLRERGQADVDAHYQIGAAYAFQATYTATVEGGFRHALGPSRRAYAEHNRVLELNPRRKDAGLVVGLYRYGVSTLGFLSRLMANLAGFDGDREGGIRLVEAAAASPSDVQTNAKFSLIVIYNREKRYDDALRVIAGLQRQFPRNRLLWLEAGSTALRAGRAPEANTALEHGLAMLASDSRPRAFGEMARWRYQHGLALAALKQPIQAEAEFAAALSGDSQDWLRDRARIELKKVREQIRRGR
jgi:tetratricopeptide (TPR) repeat protein